MKSMGKIMRERERRMSDKRRGGGRGIWAPERVMFEVAEEMGKVSSGEARNSPGKTSWGLKTTSAGEELDSSWGEERKARRHQGRWEN
jgi:hypothetical protein